MGLEYGQIIKHWLAFMRHEFDPQIRVCVFVNLIPPQDLWIWVSYMDALLNQRAISIYKPAFRSSSGCVSWSGPQVAPLVFENRCRWISLWGRLHGEQSAFLFLVVSEELGALPEWPQDPLPHPLLHLLPQEFCLVVHPLNGAWGLRPSVWWSGSHDALGTQGLLL